MMLNVGNNDTDYHTPNLGHKRFGGTWKVIIPIYLIHKVTTIHLFFIYSNWLLARRPLMTPAIM